MKGLGAGIAIFMTFVVMIIVVFAVLFGTGVIKIPTILETAGACTTNADCPAGYECKSGTCTEIPTKIVEGFPCQDDGSNTLNVLARNPLNTSYQDQAVSFAVVNSVGKVVATGTGTAAGVITYTAINVPCSANNAKGKIYAVADGAISSDVGTYSFEQATADSVDLTAENTVQLTAQFRDSTLTNTSLSAVGGATITTAVATSSGDTANGYLDLSDATGMSQFGSHHNGDFWCYDSITSAAFSDTSLSLNSQTPTFALTEQLCSLYPKAQAVDSCNRCWTSVAVKAKDGTIRVAWTLSNDGGTDAGGSDDVKLYINDIVYFQDTDGTIKLEVYNSAGTEVGETKVTNTWAIS